MKTPTNPPIPFEIVCSTALEEILSEEENVMIGDEHFTISSNLSEVHTVSHIPDDFVCSNLRKSDTLKEISDEFEKGESNTKHKVISEDAENMEEITDENMLKTQRKERKSSLRAKNGIKRLAEIENESYNKVIPKPEENKDSQFFGVNKRTRRNLASLLASERQKYNSNFSAQGVKNSDRVDVDNTKDTHPTVPETHATADKENIQENRVIMVKAIKPKGFIPHKMMHEITRRIKGPEAKKEQADTQQTTENKFFHEDLDFLKTKKQKKKEDKSNKKTYKKYLQLKEKNTRCNRGYVTVTPRRKAVIGLCSYPKTFYRKEKSDRCVYFDLEAPISVHNSSSNVPSILIEKNDTCKFEWTKEKEVVDIIRRVDITSDVSIEDFLFRRVGNSVGI